MASAPCAAQCNRPPTAGLDARVSCLDVPGLCLNLDEIICLAVASDGTWVVCTVSALYTLSPRGLTTFLAGHITDRGFTDGKGCAARFNSPQGIAVDGAGNVLVADTCNHALRKVTRDGAVSTLAGNGEAGYVEGVGDAARFNSLHGIAVDANGTIYIADSCNNCVRHVVPDDGTVSTLAGDGKEGAGIVDGLGSAARFYNPAGLAVDADGHLIVADFGNHCIRRVTSAKGCVTTVAGNGQDGGGFADGEGAAARFHFPMGIAVDGNNNILVADHLNNRIRMIAGTAGHVMTVAGSAQPGKVDGVGASARFENPRSLALDARGHLLVADKNVGCVRVVEASLEPLDQMLAARLQLEEQAHHNTPLFLQVRTRSPRSLMLALVKWDLCLVPCMLCAPRPTCASSLCTIHSSHAL